MKEHAVSATELRLLDFMLEELRSRTIRDIALQSRVDYKNCHECMSKLVEKGVVRQERVGNALVCSLDYARGAHLLAYAESKRSHKLMERLAPNVQSFAHDAVSAVCNTTKFSTILMTQNPMRLYVAVDAAGLRFPVQRGVEEARTKAGVAAEVHVVGGAELAGLLKDDGVLRQRIILYGAEAFVGMLL